MTEPTVIRSLGRHCLEGIPRADVPQRWQQVRGWLLPAIERSSGRYSERTVFDAIVNLQNQLWLIHADKPSGALVTRIAVYPTGLRALVLVLCGGERADTWMGAIEHLEHLADAKECVLIEGNGRFGWKRRLPETWTMKTAEFQRDLRKS